MGRTQPVRRAVGNGRYLREAAVRGPTGNARFECKVATRQ